MAAQAADFPIKDKPVTLIVPFAAGGPTDRVARDLAEAMRKSLGVSVVVENAAGGPGGLIGATKAARAPADGHTLLVHHIAMLDEGVIEVDGNELGLEIPGKILQHSGY